MLTINMADDCHLDKLWQQTEQLLMQKQGNVRQILEDYGIGEGEDGESDEAQLWQTVENGTGCKNDLV